MIYQSKKNSISLLSKHRFTAFVICGVINTATTYALYLALLTTMHYQMAYFLSYTSGIIVAYFLNSRFVFKAKVSAKKTMLYPLIYVAQYVIGALLSYVFVDVLFFPPQWTLLLVVAILVPISYGLNKLILADR